VHVKVVADLRGQSSIAINGDAYGYTSDDVARTSIDGLAGRVGLRPGSRLGYALGTGPKLVPTALANLNVSEASPQLKAYFVCRADRI
jgi:hypothetical protein